MANSNYNFTRTQLIMIFVASMGYFVDIYDLLIFNSERVESLASIGIAKDSMKNTGIMIQNYQMLGLILGGFIFGILGDKIGRLKVMFASIFLYSSASILNAFITDANTFALLRFIAGVGLAGELGVALTWISENLDKKQRTIATTLVSAIGLCGGITASIVADHFSWKTSYILGGVLGLILLVLRISVKESEIFENIKKQNTSRGNVFGLFTNSNQLKKYLLCILAGAPAFVFMSIFVTFSPEIFKDATFEIKTLIPKAITYYLICFAISDVLCGLFSKSLQKRKLPLLVYSVIQLFAVVYFFSSTPVTPNDFFIKVSILGFSVGMWGILITNSLEQFGTEIRSTVATSVPNLIRGITIPASILFAFLSNTFTSRESGLYTGLILIAISMISILFLKDRFERDLQFTETKEN